MQSTSPIEQAFVSVDSPATQLSHFTAVAAKNPARQVQD